MTSGYDQYLSDHPHLAEGYEYLDDFVDNLENREALAERVLSSDEFSQSEKEFIHKRIVPDKKKAGRKRESDRNRKLALEEEQLKKEGKIRCYGFSMSRLEENISDIVPDGVSLIGTAVNAEYRENITHFEALNKKNIGILGYQPLSSGISLHEKKSPQQLIIDAHNLPNVQSVVVGSSSRKHLLENVKALDGISTKY